jgi:hypothetical protein
MKYNFKTVSCPKCGAPVGTLCQTATGRDVAESYPHIDRVHAFAAKRRVSSAANKGVRELPANLQVLEVAKRSATNGFANEVTVPRFAALAAVSGLR